MTFSHDDKLNEIEKSVTSGKRLSFEDGLALYATDDLPGLGKLADMVVLSSDIMRVPPRDILTTTVRMTIVGGETVYQNP